MQKLVTCCAVVVLCAPLAVQAQGRSHDAGRVEQRDDSKAKGAQNDKVDRRSATTNGQNDHQNEHQNEHQKGKVQDRATEGATSAGERHDNGLHLGHQRGVGHENGRGRGHGHHDHDLATRDTRPACVDANRDGRCDFRADSARTLPSPQRIPVPTPTPLPSPTPRTGSVRSPGTTPTEPRVEPTRRRLPEMVPVAMIEQKRRTSDQQLWLGTANVSGRYVDIDRNGTPERITWLDGAGLVKQVWRDDDKDGRADAVAIYDRGRLTHMVRE